MAWLHLVDDTELAAELLLAHYFELQR